MSCRVLVEWEDGAAPKLGNGRKGTDFKWHWGVRVLPVRTGLRALSFEF